MFRLYNVEQIKRQNKRKVFFAALFSGVFTAGLALLFSPKSGKENREFLTKKAEEAGKASQDLAKKGGNKLNEVKEDVVEKAQTLSQKTQEFREKLADKFNSAKDKAVDETEIKLEKIKDADVK